MSKRVHVIVNPAAGRDKPILHTLNRIFHEHGADWDLTITKKAGDARRQAREAAERGVDVIAVYGGDGTVMEAASGLIGSDVPLAILPGGTANVMSLELGIPQELASACELIFHERSILHPVDMGQTGEHYFLLRIGIGFEAAMVEGADRDSKARLGRLAYILSAFQALQEPLVARYTLTLDGDEIESQGITCIVANSGNLGMAGISLASTISVSDGLLDVVVIRQADLNSLLALAASVVTKQEEVEHLQHWQAKVIRIASEPVQSVQADGEILGKTPIEVRVLPQAVRIIAPEEKGDE